MDNPTVQRIGFLRRALTGLAAPMLMIGVFAGSLAAAPAAASAAPIASAACPTYGPGSCTGTGSLGVSPGPGGTTVLQGSASPYAPGERVNGTVHSTAVSVGSWIASPTGVVNFTIVLPGGIPAGNHTLTLLGTVSGVTTVLPFTLSAATVGITPCTTSYTSAKGEVVLAAAYLSAACVSAAPPAQTPSAGTPSAVGAPASGSAAAAPSSSSQLPFTGANVATGATVGAMALLAGGLLVLSSRRRRRSAWEAKG